MADSCVLGSMVYQWLIMRHQTMFWKMLNQSLKNLAAKYQTLQSTEPIKLVKHTLIKHLRWNIKTLLFGLRPFGIELFHHGRNNLKRNVKVKLDLTKKRYSIFTEAMQLVKNTEAVKFVMADINCRLKVVFKDGNNFL